jgi:hypothetical protein
VRPAGDYFYQRRPVAADVRGAVYKLAARSGAEQAWPALLQLYKGSRDPSERQQLLLALAHAPEEASANATLALALSPSSYGKLDAPASPTATTQAQKL